MIGYSWYPADMAHLFVVQVVLTVTFDTLSPLRSITFLHAHPDDESIFTGGTIAKLTDAGVAVTVIVATDDGAGPTRRLELEEAAAVLKVDRVDFLGYPDSGLGLRPTAGSFATLPIDEPAARVADLLDEVGADALVHYDPGGIYGHPDHLAVHRIGRRAAALARVGTVYESTVDREHLHFVATHLVGDAVEALMRAAAGTPEVRPRPGSGLDGRLAGGTPTVLIDTMVDVADVLDRKRRAMAAHRSQIPAHSEVLGLDPTSFEAVYGLEWYRRAGPPTLLDRLAPTRRQG